MNSQILHILTSSLEHAQHVLSAAMSAGFRESGISGVLASGNEQATPMVAVRSSGLAFDSIVAAQDDEGQFNRMVTEDYLRTLLEVANQRFKINEERKQRFSQALIGHQPDHTAQMNTGLPPAASSTISEWEPEDVRRERKRAEGLMRREKLRKQPDEHTSDDISADCIEDLKALLEP